MTQIILVWDAVIAWRDEILKKNLLKKSKMDYLSNMAKFIERGFFDLEQPLSEFIKVGNESKLQMINQTPDWTVSTKKSRRTFLRSFYRFVQKRKIKPTTIVIPFKEYRIIDKVVISELLCSNEIKAKSQSLKTEDIVRFLAEICNINPRDCLVCWMMWEFKCTIHQVLNIRINDIDLSQGFINLQDGSKRLGTVREDLRKCILVQSNEKNGAELLFTTNSGKPVHPHQIMRNMKIASKKAKLPLMLTPTILDAYSKAYAEKEFSKMSAEEIEKLSKQYSKQYEASRKSEICP